MKNLERCDYYCCHIVHSHRKQHRFVLPFFFFLRTLLLSSLWVTGRGHRYTVVLLPPGSCLQFCIAKRVQQSHCSSIFHRVLLTHALALSASQFVCKKKSTVCKYALGGIRTQETGHARLEDNLIRHRGDRLLPLHLPDTDTSTTCLSTSLSTQHCHSSTAELWAIFAGLLL